MIGTSTLDSGCQPYSVVLMEYCEITLEEYWDQSRASRSLMEAKLVLKVPPMQGCDRRSTLSTG
jgi:hypothetical protein